jgi:iron complex transport system ATP-binding protein
MLEGRDLSLVLGARRVLTNVSLEIHPGRLTVLIGPNGAGKSSLLRLLSGEWTPSSGSVQLDGRPLQAYPARTLARRRACLPQESFLEFAFTVMEVVLLGRSPHIAQGEQPLDHEIAQTALRLVDMEAAADRLYPQLSGGEKRRVQLARVLAQVLSATADEPAYLLLDEPFNGLDLAHQLHGLQLLRKMSHSHTAICMVLHDLNQAIQVADQMVLLREGCLVKTGSPAELVNGTALDSALGTPLQRVPWKDGRLPWLIPLENPSLAQVPPTEPRRG